MIISPYHKDAMALLDVALSAAKPKNYISQYIKKDRLVAGKKSFYLSKYDKIWLVAAGKAADTMAKSAHGILQADGGIVVIPQNYDAQFANKKYYIIKAGHPTPNKNSVLAAQKITQFLQNVGKNDLVIFLVSGGASSLVCAPDGISLAQKKQITQKLLESGASISEINTIRKHLSKVKGGRILDNLRCDAVSYVMSDVVGDDLGSIGSGMVYCDKSTFSDCLGIIERYGLRKKIPKKAMIRIRDGAQGKIPETPKKPI
ncbi:MAG: glycerate-2-kinase family protein, partial [Thaumarchaeota archaeon]|nr:glycerate-2-kinase family protein [Nitrososphaerota archaeon]